MPNHFWQILLELLPLIIRIFVDEDIDAKRRRGGGDGGFGKFSPWQTL